MPTYQYACTECDHQLEAVQSFTDAALTDCPECTGRLRKRYSGVGIVFKGSGFYRTDSRAGSSASGNSGDSSGSDSSGTTEASTPSGSKEASTPAGSTPSKPAETAPSSGPAKPATKAPASTTS